MGPVVTDGSTIAVIFISLRRHYPVRFVRSTAPSRPLSTLGVRSRALFGWVRSVPHATLPPPATIRARRAVGSYPDNEKIWWGDRPRWDDVGVQHPKEAGAATPAGRQ